MTTTRALAAAALLFATPGHAQSLEQSYADQCSGGKQNETCDALRKALMEKLTGQGQAASETGAPPAAAASKAPVVSHDAWGPLAELVTDGAFYAPNASLFTFRWSDDGQAIVMTDHFGNLVSHLTLNPDKTVSVAGYLGGIAGRFRLTPLSNGLYVSPSTDPDARAIFGLENGTYVYRFEKRIGGAWQSLTKNGGAYTKLGAQELSGLAQSLKAAQTPTAIAANWGVWAKLSGSSWVTKVASVRMLRSYDWGETGLVLRRGDATLVGKDVRREPTPMYMIAAYDPFSGGVSQTVKVMPDGSLMEDLGTVRTITRWEGDGFAEITEMLKDGKWKHYTTSRYSRAGPADMSETIARLTTRNSGGGGLFGTLLGAAVGGVAAVAGGADGGTAAGLMMQGAAVTSGNAQMAAAMAKGSAEVAASNAQMEAQLQNSINRGLAQGNAQYRAAQGSSAGQRGASSSGIEVRRAQAAPAPALATTATPELAAPAMLYWRCMAAKGGTPTIYSSTFAVPTGSRWDMMTLRSAYDQFLRARGSGFLRSVSCRSAGTMVEAETLSSFNTTGQTIETVDWIPQ